MHFCRVIEDFVHLDAHLERISDDCIVPNEMSFCCVGIPRENFRAPSFQSSACMQGLDTPVTALAPCPKCLQPPWLVMGQQG